MSTAPIKWKRSSKMLRTLPTFCSSLASRNSKFSTMVSARALLLAATCCAYLWVVHGEDSSFETRSLDGFPMKSQEEKDLIEALQEVLQKLRSKEMPSEKKLGWLPSCDAGEQCAVRKGARIGTLCGCPRGTACNFYVLKCL